MDGFLFIINIYGCHHNNALSCQNSQPYYNLDQNWNSNILNQLIVKSTRQYQPA